MNTVLKVASTKSEIAVALFVWLILPATSVVIPHVFAARGAAKSTRAGVWIPQVHKGSNQLIGHRN